MAIGPSVTVVVVSGDDDGDWGEEDEVVWSKGVHDQLLQIAASGTVTR